MRKIRAFLAGNPNSGKTTIFNALTGSHQAVGNYPGVTVEQKIGTREWGNVEFEFVDLPGMYSFTSDSLDEKVARDFVVKEPPDVVINVIDASNVERSLYLTVQFMEMRLPVVLAFNMSDIAEASGLKFDYSIFERNFGMQVVRMVGHKKEGVTELLHAAVRAAGKGFVDRDLRQGKRLVKELDKVVELVSAEPGLSKEYDAVIAREGGARWLALKLLELDGEISKLVAPGPLKEQVSKSVEHLQKLHGDTPTSLIAERRYGFISGACQEAIKNTAEIKHTSSDAVDAVLTHRVFGLPIFLALMYLFFTVTFRLGYWPMRLLEITFESLSWLVNYFWPDDHFDWLRSLIDEGIIAGVGGVVVFLPLIMILFAIIAILEDSGYMARAAFVMDRLMHKIGLHGKSFIPMLVGFGCTVPAIMATRILDSRRNRLITMLVLPLISCGARLPIYTLLVAAFFPKQWQAAMFLLIYSIGIVLAVIGAKVLGITVLRGETPGLVMELPPYHIPTLRSIMMHMWERSWLYLKKAGTIILAISVVMWAMNSYPKSEPSSPDLSPEEVQSEQLANSISGRIGKFMEPALKPLGLDWKIGTAFIGAFAAKEVFVAQLGIINAVDGHTGTAELRESLRRQYSPLAGFSMMLFSLIAFPCMATVAITRAESGRWGWALFQLIGLTVLGYVFTLVAYQLGLLFGLG